MTRGRWTALVAVVLVLLGALTLGARGGADDVAASPAPVVVDGLPACPPALTTALAPAALPCFGGGPDVEVSGAPGTPMLVNLWATWCAPCVEEVPLLVEAEATLRGRVGVVGVVHQDDPASVAAFVEAFGVTYPLLRDDAGDTLRTFGSAPPRTLFVAADGTVAYEQVGGFDSVAQVEELVAEHLGAAL